MADSVEKQVGSWVGKGVDKARKDLLPRLPDQYRKGADEVLKHVETHKDLAGRVSAIGFAQIVSYTGLGMLDEAERVWLRETATATEIDAALSGAAKASHKTFQEKAAAWAETKKFALDLLKIGGPIALQILLAMV